jgi:hypothetical protein
MTRGWHWGLLACALSACFKPNFTHCENADCPPQTVCDGFGGCAVPDQLAQCSGATDGTQCSYKNLLNVLVDGSCDTGVCRSAEIPACLTDSFSATRVDSSAWDLWLPANTPVIVSEDSGQLAVSLASDIGLVYNGVQSRGRYDMVGGEVHVEVTPASQDIGVETDFLVDLDSGLGFQMSAYANRLHLIMHTSGGVTSSMAIDFDPVMHHYWRARHDATANAIVLETSPDGNSWTSQRSDVLPRLPNTVIVSLLAGTYVDAGVAMPGTAYFSGLKLVSAACP